MCVCVCYCACVCVRVSVHVFVCMCFGQVEQLLRAEEEDPRLMAAIESKRSAKEQLVGIVVTLAAFCEV